MPRLPITLQQLPQHGLKDAAVAIVLELYRCIDTAGRQELDRIAFPIGHADFYLVTGLQIVIDEDLERADAGEAKRAAILALLVDQRQHAHADEIRSVD